MKQTAALLVDGNNVSISLAGTRLDVDKLRALIGRSYSLQEAHYFLAVRAVMDEKTYDRHRSFVNMLVDRQYQVHEKQMRRAGPGWKGDCDMEIALQAADSIQSHEWLLLMTNDSDFQALIDYVHSKAKKIAILSVDGDCAVELRNLSDRYIDLSEETDLFFLPTNNRREGGEPNDDTDS